MILTEYILGDEILLVMMNAMLIMLEVMDGEIRLSMSM